MEEIWKEVNGFEGVYEISSFGKIKTLERLVKCKGGKTRKITERLLYPVVDAHGYKMMTLCFNGSSKKIKVHQLVAIAFLGHTPNGFISVIDHIDNNKLNNHKDNLQITTMRHNSSKDQFRRNRSSKYTGVSWNAIAKKWNSIIMIDGITKRLGTFSSEEMASEKYQKALRDVLK